MNKFGSKNVVIWGLRNRKHSHRHIHKGFSDNFTSIGYETKWLDDLPFHNIENSIIFASGMAIKYLPISRTNIYILHNVSFDLKQQLKWNSEEPKHLFLQVYTKDAVGEQLGSSPIVLYSPLKNTLYQPWGTPLPPKQWEVSVPENSINLEFWIGSVWQNSQNQGNLETIEEYKKVLYDCGISFKQIKRSKWTLSGVSEETSKKIIRKSVLGASIVGDWQRTQQYIPCRIFKNLSYGVPPITNLNVDAIFSESAISNNNLEKLVGLGLGENAKSREKRLKESQEILKNFTYQSAIRRMLNLI